MGRIKSTVGTESSFLKPTKAAVPLLILSFLAAAPTPSPALSTRQAASGVLHSFTGTGWHLVSSPYTLRQGFAAMGITAFAYTNGAYVATPDAPADQFRPGQGYWVYLKSNQLDINGPGTPVDTSQPFSITLSQGWNMIGDPYTTPIPLSSITVNGTALPAALASGTVLAGALFTYDGTQYQAASSSTDMLNPWDGAWIYSRANGVVLSFSSGNSTPAMSFDQRKAVLDAISQKETETLGADGRLNSSALLAYIQTRPEFTSSGISQDGSVWAWFQDGREIIVTDTTTVSPASAVPSLTNPSMTRARSITRQQAGLPDSLPGSSQFRLINTMADSIAFPAMDQFLNQVLPAQGYTPAGGDNSGTVESLKTVTGDGIFVLSAHGGLGNSRSDGTGAAVPGLWTSSPIDPLGDVAYGVSGDFGNPLTNEPARLCYMSAPDHRMVIGSGPAGPIYANVWHYGILPPFAEKYWSFAPASFVLIDACSSALLGFDEACYDRGASVFGGWTNPGGDRDMAGATIWLFDRLTGANSSNGWIQPETPPQRAFDLFDLLTEMRTEINPWNGLQYGTSVAMENGHTYQSMLQVRINPAGGNFISYLAPIVSQVFFDQSTEEMLLSGAFGHDSSAIHVSVGGQDVNVKGFNEIGQVVTSLPASGGLLVVTVNGHHSSPVALTEWTIPLHFVDTLGGATRQVDVTYHLVGFVERLLGTRQPGQPIPSPLDPTDPAEQSLVVLPDSTATVKASGSYTVCYPFYGGYCDTTSWSTAGNTGAALTPPSFDPVPDGMLRFSVDSPVTLMTDSSGKMSLSVALTVVGNVINRTITSAVNGNSTALIDGGVEVLPSSGEELLLPVDANLNVIGGSNVSTHDDPFPNSTTMSLPLTEGWTWGNVSPNFFPDSSLGRATGKGK